jgi:ribosomal L5P family C-terminus
MYLFLDKMVQVVLPRIPDWPGINPVGNNGSLTFTLPPQAVGYFPDIEPHFDMFPRLVETSVTFVTNANTDSECALLLSGLQVPIMDEKVVKAEKEKVEDDPWALLKTAATREERKALAATIEKKRK